jgi:RNA polymerase subunit RPABC4/transcription elongation factor Spt4
MKLRSSRLCLDCEEIHDAQQCPACASESFVYLTKWVPVTVAPEAPTTAAVPADAAVYKRLLVADAVGPKAARLLAGKSGGAVPALPGGHPAALTADQRKLGPSDRTAPTSI